MEQNRKAARESRRRKKTMIEELQRSVIFFSRANSTLKQQNDELSRLLCQAQLAALENGPNSNANNNGQQQMAARSVQAATTDQQQQPPQCQPAPVPAGPGSKPVAPSPTLVKSEDQLVSYQQAQAQAVATQAVLESQVHITMLNWCSCL